MILKGNRRGGAKDLALHLMKDENDHVEVHELRGFVAGNLMGALNETYALSRGTRCQKFLYSMSVNPPPNEAATTDDILSAIKISEKALKLTGQPRAIVFHEKDGRRHAHVVWSLINAREMKAVRLRNDRMTLQPITRQLFIKHGWEMPKGLLDRTNRDPRSFTLKEYHAAKKHGRDAKQVKAAIQTAWAISDSRAAFVAALEERGMKLAKGDRAGFVCIDIFGECHGLRQALGATLRIKDIRAKIGDERKEPDTFLSVEDAKAKLAMIMLSTVKRLSRENDARNSQQTEEYERRKADLISRQKTERISLATRQEARRVKEAHARQLRFRTGLKGLWDTLRGHTRKIRRENEADAQAAAMRDRDERDVLIFQHLRERQQVNLFKLELHEEFAREQYSLEHDLERYDGLHLEHSRNVPEM